MVQNGTVFFDEIYLNFIYNNDYMYVTNKGIEFDLLFTCRITKFY
jgi:hypothetical protein